MHSLVFHVMDRLCEYTGHHVFMCWNRGEGRVRYVLHRLWEWSLELDKRKDG